MSYKKCGCEESKHLRKQMEFWQKQLDKIRREALRIQNGLIRVLDNKEEEQ